MDVYWFYRTYFRKIKITSFKMATVISIKKRSKGKGKGKGKGHPRTGHVDPEGE
jgi:hypothetical protein